MCRSVGLLCITSNIHNLFKSLSASGVRVQRVDVRAASWGFMTTRSGPNREKCLNEGNQIAAADREVCLSCVESWALLFLLSPSTFSCSTLQANACIYPKLLGIYMIIITKKMYQTAWTKRQARDKRKWHGFSTILALLLFIILMSGKMVTIIILAVTMRIKCQ